MSQRDNPSPHENEVVVKSTNGGGSNPTAKRLLDLNRIQTPGLQILSPTAKEIDALKIDAEQALDNYANRLREGYKTNKEGFRNGLKILSDSLDKGEQISIVCACRNAKRICHADVVKMAIEKVNAYLKNERINEKIRNDIAESHGAGQDNSIKQLPIVNPRTRAAINEILSLSENDRVLEKINETDGRNRSEQASFLGESSQFVRDIYERGGNIIDGNLIVPQEKLTNSPPLSITTQDYAVSRIGKILQDEVRAKELAPVVVEYGNKIAGLTADGETKLKVFGWMYDSLEGKSENLQRDEKKSFGEKSNFDEALEKISVLAEEMHSLEPPDKIEFVPLAGFEQNEIQEAIFDKSGENLNLEKIYEEAISLEEGEKAQFVFEQAAPEQADITEPSGKINWDGYERIELPSAPRIPEDFTNEEITRFITEILPEIDRQIESGLSPREILDPYTQAVSRSAKDDAQNRLESIYRKQKNSKDEIKHFSGLSPDSNQNLEQQLTAKIDLRRQNIIELKNPGEFLAVEKAAVNIFYRQQKLEVGNLLTKIDEVREKQLAEGDKTEEIALKKELINIREAKPNFAFKLENSAEIVVGKPSEQSVERRNFVLSYINYQLKQPETRLRFENERYRVYAARLESAATREDVMKFASRIRAENASLGMKWKDLEKSEKVNRARPLTSKEMQFLFTESSPAHYTNEMTAARLSYAHSGASRRQVAESLIKGEIKPSPEADKLIQSLESRLQRREIKDSLLATKHFFESIKSPDELLKYKNSFDHREIYQKLPPQEKDFVYARATQQKENLEYQLVFKKQQLSKGEEINRIEKPKSEISQAEKSFHLRSAFNQARILGEKVEQPALAQKEIGERDCNAIAVLLNNQPVEKLENLAQEFQKSENLENKKIGEVVQTFARAEISQSENKTFLSIELPPNRLVSVETYQELLEKFYPDNMRENEKYKFERFAEKEVSRALQKGQDETINSFRDEIKANIYQKDASLNVLETETAILEKLDKIAQFQTEARRASRENKGILGKYITRVSLKMQNQKAEVPSLSLQKEIVKLALGGKTSNLASNKVHDRFFQAAQREIKISDFQKFSANETLLEDMKANIKNEFAEISEGLKLLEKSRIHSARTPASAEKEQKTAANIADQEIFDSKPYTLRLFEKELEKAEKGLLGASLKEKLSKGNDLEKANNFNRATIFSTEERAAIKAKAFERVLEKLEPKELSADNRRFSPEASRQAFATYKQLGKASNLLQTSVDKLQIAESFSKLDREASALNKIRQDYNRNEKMAVLRNGIKTDLVDWFKKNADAKQAGMEGQINKILMNNLKQVNVTKFSDDRGQISELSRQIAEKLESKQIFASGGKEMAADSRETIKQTKNHYSLKNENTKANLSEKVKDAPIFTR
jgi:hypothetical protein